MSRPVIKVAMIRSDLQLLLLEASSFTLCNEKKKTKITTNREGDGAPDMFGDFYAKQRFFFEAFSELPDALFFRQIFLNFFGGRIMLCPV